MGRPASKRHDSAHSTGPGYLSRVIFRYGCAVSRKPGFSSDPAVGQPADAADLASTDMSAEGPAGAAQVPVEPASQDPVFEAELRDLRDRHLRLAAEFDNYRKRVARERSELTDRAQATFITRLLDVLDDLDRLVADDTTRTIDAMRETVVMIDRKLRKELEAAGVERVDPVGQPFDPAEHEAVSVVPAPDPSKDHLVSATFQTGYRFKGALVRPARVQVYSVQDAV